jgi:hypothetical protein
MSRNSNYLGQGSVSYGLLRQRNFLPRPASNPSSISPIRLFSWRRRWEHHFPHPSIFPAAAAAAAMGAYVCLDWLAQCSLIHPGRQSQGEEDEICSALPPQSVSQAPAGRPARPTTAPTESVERSCFMCGGLILQRRLAKPDFVGIFLARQPPCSFTAANRNQACQALLYFVGSRWACVIVWGRNARPNIKSSLVTLGVTAEFADFL